MGLFVLRLHHSFTTFFKQDNNPYCCWSIDEACTLLSTYLTVYSILDWYHLHAWYCPTTWIAFKYLLRPWPYFYLRILEETFPSPNQRPRHQQCVPPIVLLTNGGSQPLFRRLSSVFHRWLAAGLILIFTMDWVALQYFLALYNQHDSILGRIYSNTSLFTWLPHRVFTNWPGWLAPP